MKIYRPMSSPESTPAERVKALKDAKELMSGNAPGGIVGAFGGSKQAPGTGAEVITGFMRLADYITTGHAYEDNRPKASASSLEGAGILIIPSIIRIDNDDAGESVNDAMNDINKTNEEEGSDNDK